MIFSSAGGLSVLLFMAIVIGVCMMFIGAVGVVSERLEFSVNRQVLKTSLGLMAWLGFGAFVTYTNLMEGRPYPVGLLYFALVIAASIGVAMSRFGNRLALGLSLSALVLFQGFRLPLDMILHQWAEHGTIPYTMTWTGYNYDALAGLLALLLTPFANNHKKLVWVFNVVGIVLMINAMYVGTMSSPLPFAWDIEPRLLLIYYIPYFLIVPVCVGGSLAGHVILTKALLYKQ